MSYLIRSGIVLAGSVFCLSIGVINIDAQGRKPHIRHDAGRRHQTSRRHVNDKRNETSRSHEASRPGNSDSARDRLKGLFTYRGDLVDQRSGYTRNGYLKDPPNYSPYLQNDNRYRTSRTYENTPNYNYDYGYLTYPTRSPVNVKIWFGNPRPDYFWPHW